VPAGREGGIGRGGGGEGEGSTREAESNGGEGAQRQPRSGAEGMLVKGGTIIGLVTGQRDGERDS